MASVLILPVTVPMATPVFEAQSVYGPRPSGPPATDPNG